MAVCTTTVMEILDGKQTTSVCAHVRGQIVISALLILSVCASLRGNRVNNKYTHTDMEASSTSATPELL